MRAAASANDAHHASHARLVQKRLQLFDVFRHMPGRRPHIGDIADAVESRLQSRQHERDLSLQLIDLGDAERIDPTQDQPVMLLIDLSAMHGNAPSTLLARGDRRWATPGAAVPQSAPVNLLLTALHRRKCQSMVDPATAFSGPA